MAGQKWTKEELQIILDNPKLTNRELAELIPNRTINGVRVQREKLYFEEKTHICTRCKKPFTRKKRGDVNCEACAAKILQERRIKKQLEKRNNSQQDEEAFIAKLQSKERTCSICGKTKPGTEFNVDRSTKVLRGQCRTCLAEKAKKLRKKRISEGRDW